MQAQKEKRTQIAKALFSKPDTDMDLLLARPPMELFETKDGFEAVLDMPGIDKDQIQIELEDFVLSIKAKPKSEQDKELKLVYHEYDSVGFSRKFTISPNVDLKKIEAVAKDGVLRLRLPKKKGQKPQTIKVK